MQVDQLEGFLAIADAGSLNKAAAELSLHQPTLTARLHALERELGEPLFAREPTGMRLTDAGRAFLPHAKNALSALRDGRQSMHALRTASGGRLIIGAAPAVSTYALPELLGRFKGKHPKVAIAVRTGHSEDVLQMVLRDEVHIGFMRLIAHPDIATWPFFDEELVLVVSPRHRFARSAQVRPAELGRESLILFDKTSSYYEMTQAWFTAHRVTPRAVMELDNIEAAKRMVERRLGIALLPKTALKRDCAAGYLRIVRLSNARPISHSIVAARRRDVRLPSGATAALLGMLQPLRAR